MNWQACDKSCVLAEEIGPPHGHGQAILIVFHVIFVFPASSTGGTPAPTHYEFSSCPYSSCPFSATTADLGLFVLRIPERDHMAGIVWIGHGFDRGKGDNKGDQHSPHCDALFAKLKAGEL